MNIGSTFNHEKYGPLTIKGKAYSRLGNKVLWVVVDQNGKKMNIEEAELAELIEKSEEKERKEAEKEEIKRQKEIEKEQKPMELTKIAEAIRFQKGDPGVDADEERVIQAVIPQVLAQIRLPKDGDPGKDSDVEEVVTRLLPLVMAEIPEPDKPKEVDIPALISKIMARIRIPKDGKPGEDGKPGKDGSPDSPEEIKDKLQSLRGNERLDASAIKNLPNSQIGGGGGPNSLQHLEDVRLTNPTNNQSLTYDSASGKWVNETVSGGSGDVATDAIWDAKGDLAVGTGANTASRLAVGTNGQVLTADSAEVTGTKWATPSAGYTDEQAQDAVGGMVDTTLEYVDATPLLKRAALTGDITAPSGSNATTLATVNANVGTFVSGASYTPQITVNAKGLVTAASQLEISIAQSQVNNLITALDAKVDTAGDTMTGDLNVPDEAYDATNWNGSLEVPTKNAIRDKIETMLGSSGITRTVTVSSGSFTAGSSASTDYMYFIAGAHTASLPAAAGNTNRYTFKNNHSANITIDTVGAETIEGAASISVAPQESVDVMSDGTNYFVI